MSYTVVFHPLSEQEYYNAYEWYGEQQTSLENRFEDAISSLLDKITARPLDYGYNRKPYREATVESFPFTIVYRVSKYKKRIYISAIYHTARNPEKKYR